ncbi:MAG: Asp23/Gls24 family envelope stress response protein [Spirochaetales bacterium]|jgi:adenylate kinase family enzyme|nr:Asp23/Gls24 family envelope stress response protein [Spirochaetales bacterium]
MKNAYRHLVWLLKGVKVFALVGKSGTGKSFRAKLLAQKYGIELIIDDGLLIRDQKIIAGRSAKKETSYMAAVKTAVFHDRAHRQEVTQCLEKQKFRRILIIGTSEGMVRKIAETLRLPPPGKIIQIEDIATEDEIQTALHHRNVHGRHIIPVPSIEVKRNYPKTMADSIKIFLKQQFGLGGQQVFEKSVIRPEFSKKGEVTLSESALTQMLLHCLQENNRQIKLKKVTIKNDGPSYHIDLAISVPYGMELIPNINELQNYIVTSIERFTGIMIQELNVTIDSIT